MLRFPCCEISGFPPLSTSSQKLRQAIAGSGLTKLDIFLAKRLKKDSTFESTEKRSTLPWAIQDHGFGAVIAPSFADIFRNNSTKNGLLAIDLPEETVQKLLQVVRDDPETVITIELDELTVTAPNVHETFEMDEFTRRRIMEGLDDISLTLTHEDELDVFERSRPDHLPTVH